MEIIKLIIIYYIKNLHINSINYESNIINNFIYILIFPNIMEHFLL
jgi:hypothetical protein